MKYHDECTICASPDIAKKCSHCGGWVCHEHLRLVNNCWRAILAERK